jgi:hypothetical protein
MKPEQPTDINDFIMQQRQAGVLTVQKADEITRVQALIEGKEQEILRIQEDINTLRSKNEELLATGDIDQALDPIRHAVDDRLDEIITQAEQDYLEHIQAHLTIGWEISLKAIRRLTGFFYGNYSTNPLPATNTADEFNRILEESRGAELQTAVFQTRLGEIHINSAAKTITHYPNPDNQIVFNQYYYNRENYVFTKIIRDIMVASDKPNEFFIQESVRIGEKLEVVTSKTQYVDGKKRYKIVMTPEGKYKETIYFDNHGNEIKGNQLQIPLS